MSLIFLLFAVGIALLAVELIVPGMIIGLVGALAILAGVVVAFADYGAQGGLGAATLAMLVLAAVIYAELVWLPKSRLARIFSMRTTLSGKSQPPVADAEAVLGAEAIAETVLAPSGYVVVKGRRYEAFAQDGYAAAGTHLRVSSVDNFRLIVTAV